MPAAATFGFFLAAALALLIVPGPSVLYIVTRSVDQGRIAGLVSVLGIELGALVHVAFAAVGLSALLASSAAAFTIVKWLGAAYLVWLGLRRLLARDDEDVTVTIEQKKLSRVLSQGVIVTVFNPKTALFFLAFLPQFVDPSRGPVGIQIVVLGITFVVLAFLTDGIYAVLSGTAAGWIRGRPGFRRGQRYVSGGVYLMLGAATAVSGSGKD